MKNKQLHKSFFYIVLTVLLLIVSVISGGDKVPAFAETKDIKVQYEASDVLNDLKGSTVNGDTFDLSDYPFDENGKPEIVSFVEYCYTYRTDKQSDFGLFVYVYNPQGLAIDTSTERNKIQFAYGKQANGNLANWDKYLLQFLNYSKQSGYEGLFYKFKVKLSDERRADVLKTIGQNSRVYEISSIELSVKDSIYVEDYEQALVYTYSGYAKGYGSELATEDTLTCTVDGLKETLSLNVHSTYWRPEGTHSDGYTRDTLHSVYFSVPNDKIKRYGEMTAVHATWLNAYTAPIFVTGNSEVYNALLPYLSEYMDGGSVKNYQSKVNYALVATKAVDEAQTSPYAANFGYYAYNTYLDSGDELHDTHPEYDKTIDYLNYIFLAEGEEREDYIIPAEKLIGDKEKGVKGWFETFTERFGGIVQTQGGPTDFGDGDTLITGPSRPSKGGLVNDRYSAVLFDKVDTAFTEVTIEATDRYKLTDNTVSNDLWSKLFGNTIQEGTPYEMSAIQKVTSEDINFYSDVASFCKKFYIAESDYKDFCSYLNTAEEREETVYLFRYYQSEYVSNIVTEYERTTDWALIGGNFGSYKAIDTKAYFAQEWVQLDFDIIDLTFTKDRVKTVIPVIMSPMDIAADLEPPVDFDPGESDWWVFAAVSSGVVLGVLIVTRIVKSKIRKR